MATAETKRTRVEVDEDPESASPHNGGARRRPTGGAATRAAISAADGVLSLEWQLLSRGLSLQWRLIRRGLSLERRLLLRLLERGDHDHSGGPLDDEAVNHILERLPESESFWHLVNEIDGRRRG